ncbi:MAG: NAD-binding protein, partial [Fimbriimonadaceae bacterium]
MAKVLVCGLGQVGFRVARLLAQTGHQVTAVSLDLRQEFEDQLLNLGVKIKRGDARAESSLFDAGIIDADALIACTDDDLTNVEMALDARRLCPSLRIVVRIFDQGLAGRLEQTKIVDRALGMSVVAAPIFATAAAGNEWVGRFRHQGEGYGVLATGENLTIEKLTPTVMTPGRSSPRRFGDVLRRFWRGAPPYLRNLLIGITVVGMISVFVFQVGMNLSIIDSFYFVVTTLTTTGYGDITTKDSAIWVKLYGCLLMLLGSAASATLYSLLTDYIVSERFNQLMGRQTTTHENHTIVAGLGNVGFRIASLLAEMNQDVVVIDNKTEPEYRSVLGDRVTFIMGDARDPTTLERAGIERASAMIAATDNDAVNLSIGLATKEANPNCRVVTRMFDDRLAEKVEVAMRIDVAISASKVAAPLFVAAAVEPEAIHAFMWRERLMAVLNIDGEMLL